MSFKGKEKYHEESGAFNFFPEFKLKFNLKMFLENQIVEKREKIENYSSDSSVGEKFII